MAFETDLETAAAHRDDLPDPDEVYDFDAEIDVTDLFDAAFVREHTAFESFDELVAASPSDAGSADELETVPHGEWDEFVADATAFDDEQAFVLAARDHWVAKRLDLA
ncbi:hypothetical protein [Natrinema salifodinae]|uniref:Uncharacterized protein n=1 Tax=Natrinema salifodinae TaxID=1202768 RepID=A0A1I0LX80_9EURY|nr:hypothetical protein [Natrinema salifodinae]SEV80250.1 hypothetical protein SAMN05216285_0089 [Natrinema salifodinae]